MLSCSNTSCSAFPIAERWCDFCGCSIKAKGARGSLTLSLRWPHIATTLRHLWPSQIPWLHSNPIEMYPMPKHSLMQKIEISRFALEWGPPQYRVIRKFAGKCGSPLPPWGSGNVDIRVDLFHIILNGTWGFDSKRVSYATSAGLKSSREGKSHQPMAQRDGGVASFCDNPNGAGASKGKAKSKFSRDIAHNEIFEEFYNHICNEHQWHSMWHIAFSRFSASRIAMAQGLLHSLLFWHFFLQSHYNPNVTVCAI